MSFSMNAQGQLAPGFAGDVNSWDAISTLLTEPMALPFPVEFHFMRHGESEANANSVVAGTRDVLLTNHGREQARLVGTQLARRYDVAFHSRLSRSIETLRLAVEADQIKVGAVYGDARLNERCLGELELSPIQHIEAFARGDLSYAPPGGDSYAEVARRLLSFLIDLTVHVRQTATTTILICGHMGPMRMLAGIFEGQSDPAEVLARNFKNTEILRYRWTHLALPAFLAGK